MIQGNFSYPRPFTAYNYRYNFKNNNIQTSYYLNNDKSQISFTGFKKVVAITSACVLGIAGIGGIFISKEDQRREATSSYSIVSFQNSDVEKDFNQKFIETLKDLSLEANYSQEKYGYKLKDEIDIPFNTGDIFNSLDSAVSSEILAKNLDTPSLKCKFELSRRSTDAVLGGHIYHINVEMYDKDETSPLSLQFAKKEAIEKSNALYEFGLEEIGSYDIKVNTDCDIKNLYKEAENECKAKHNSKIYFTTTTTTDSKGHTKTNTKSHTKYYDVNSIRPAIQVTGYSYFDQKYSLRVTSYGKPK